MALPMYLAVGDGCHLSCVALVGQFGILHMAAVFQDPVHKLFLFIYGYCI